jgi:hypothetical protein
MEKTVEMTFREGCRQAVTITSLAASISASLSG